MKLCISLALAIGAVFTGGCGFNLGRYKNAVKDGFAKIPQAAEIEDLLGEADHFISYSGPGVKQDWNTEVHFAGRYCLTMQVDVKVNSSFSKIVEVIGEPKFYLGEITGVEVFPDGTVGASSDQGCQYAEFGLKEWNKVVQAKGDFSVVGVPIKKGQPVPNFEKYVEATRRPRIQVRPDQAGRARIPPADYIDVAKGAEKPALVGGCVKDGFTKIPQAGEIEDLLGEADHFISYSGPGVKQDWNTEVYFAGRYRLTMQVDVKVNSSSSKNLDVIGEPTFCLGEITRVEVAPNGSVRVFSDQPCQHAKFGVKEWNKVVQAKGDFSVVGVAIKKDQPVPNFEQFVEAMRRGRVQVRPDHAGRAIIARADYIELDKGTEKPPPTKAK